MNSRIEIADEVWIASAGVQITQTAAGLIVENFATDKRSVSLRFPIRVQLTPDAGSFTVRVAGEVQLGSGFGVVPTVDGVEHYPIPLDSWSRFRGEGVARVGLRVELGPRCKVLLREFWLTADSNVGHLFDEQIEFSPHLIVTPTYPSSNHLYLSGFVHSRVREYRRRGVRPVVVCAFASYAYQCAYEFEGVRVLRGGLTDLLSTLNKHDFNKIGLHFFDEHYGLVLDRASGNKDTEVLLWCHGPETLFWDLPRVNGAYFAKPVAPDANTVARYKAMERVVRSFERRPNVKWIFVSEWMRQRSRELLGLEFERSVVIPNTIDTQLFSPVAKSDVDRRRVLMIRRYDNEQKYAVDLAVQAIVELSHRPVFSKLEFTIVGDGPSHETLFAPLAGLPNITFVKRFASHEEIAKLHASHGIGLFPTRYDSQGVSSCEAASSGLVVVSSDSSAIAQFIPPSLGLLAPENEAMGLANIIERFANDPSLHARTSKKLSAHIRGLCGSDATIAKELALLEARPQPVVRLPVRGAVTKSVAVTVVVPVFNMGRLLARCLSSMLSGGDLSALEVLVVDDGSTDRSVEIARGFEVRFPGVVRVIEKANGGHGSTINRGLLEARGRYFRAVDSDDWVDPSAFSEFLRRIVDETADVVLTDFAEDWAHRNDLVERDLYSNIQPDVLHSFDLMADARYGFRSWGPTLATATFKTAKLRKAGLRLSEKMAYVDMEYCTLGLTYLDTLRYYELSVYRYFLGRPNQTVERASFEKKYLHHERVIFRIAGYLESPELSEAKRGYIVRNIITPLVHSHRMILADWLQLEDELRMFDRGLRRFAPLRDLHLPEKTFGRFGRISEQLARIAVDSVKLLLPYRFVEQLQPNTLSSPRRATRYALEYFTPAVAVRAARDLNSGRAFWYEQLMGDALRVLGRRQRLLSQLRESTAAISRRRGE